MWGVRTESPVVEAGGDGEHVTLTHIREGLTVGTHVLLGTAIVDKLLHHPGRNAWPLEDGYALSMRQEGNLQERNK